MKHNLRKNRRKVEITPPMGDAFVVEAKGRNSASQKLFGVRANQAIHFGLVKAIRNLDALK